MNRSPRLLRLELPRQFFQGDAQGRRQHRPAGARRQSLAVDPQADRCLIDPDPLRQDRLGQAGVSEYFTKHTQYLAIYCVASIAIHIKCKYVDFSSLLRDHMAKRGLSHARMSALVGVSPSFVSLIVSKRSKLPIDSAEKWAIALKLSPDEQRDFIEYANLEHAPQAVRDLIESLRSELSALSADVEQLRAEIRDLAPPLLRVAEEPNRYDLDVLPVTRTSRKTRT